MTADAIYTVTGDYAANNNAKILEFVAKHVEVSGRRHRKDGQKMIAIKTIKAATRSPEDRVNRMPGRVAWPGRFLVRGV
jgi:hypothetical protein